MGHSALRFCNGRKVNTRGRGFAGRKRIGKTQAESLRWGADSKRRYFALRPLAGNKPRITPRKAANKLMEVAVVIAINTLSENGALPE